MAAITAPQCHPPHNPAFIDASKMVASAALRLAGAAAEEAAHAEGARDRGVCRHWAKGYCALGESCAFPHVGPSPAPAGGGAVVVNGVATDAIPSPAELREQDMFVVVKSSVPCKDYQAAKCHRGDKCKFAHVGGPPRRAVVCRDWQQGRCARGDACRYRHARSYPGDDCDDDDDYDYDAADAQPTDPAAHPGGVTRVTYVRSAPGAQQQQLAGAAAQPVQRIVRYYTTSPASAVCNYASPATPSVMPPLCDYSSPPAAPPAAYPAFYPDGSPQDMTAPGCHWDAPNPVPQLLPPVPPPQPQGLCTPPLLPQPHPVSLPAGCEPLLPVQQPQLLLVNGVPQAAAAVQLCCEAEAEAEDLRRRVDEMEAHAASLRAQAEAAEQHAALLRSDKELRVQAAAAPVFDGGSQSDRPESDDTMPTSPRRSFSYAATSDRPDGGMSDASDRAPTPPMPAEQQYAAAFSRRTSEGSPGGVVMRHDPYAC